MRTIIITMLSGALAFAGSFLASNDAHAAGSNGARQDRSIDVPAQRFHDVGVEMSEDARVDIRLCNEIDLDACVVTDEKVICDGTSVDMNIYAACVDAHDGPLGKAASAATASGSGCGSCSMTPEGLVPGSGAALAAIAGLALVAARRRREQK